MLAKLYWLTWLAMAVIAALFFVTGNMTAMALVVFGFFAFGLVFMGMMNVLPTVVGHQVHEPVSRPKETPEIRTTAGITMPHGARSVRV